MAFSPMKTGLSRVFLQKGGARPDRALQYHSCMKAGALEQSYGDITKIECPHPTKPDTFIEVGEIQEAEERPTTQLMGRYPADEASELKQIADLRCLADLHINIGLCQDVSIADDFSKKLIFEYSRVTNYATDEIGALSSDEREVVNETADVSGRLWYEVLPLDFQFRAGDLLTNEVVDVAICEEACAEGCDPCQSIFAITLSAGGSPSTPADVVFSLDGGSNWYAVDVDTLGAAENPTGIACVGKYVVVISDDSNSLHYALRSEFTVSPTTVAWTEVSTGFVVGGEPQAIWSVGNTAFVVGNSGYVYKLTDPTSGVTVLDAGVADGDALNDVHAVSETFMVAVGDHSSVVKTENGTTVSAVSNPAGFGVNLYAVWVKDDDNDVWFAGGDDGNLYYTLDGGVTWSSIAFSGTIEDIAFASKSVGYMSNTVSSRARIYRTYNGGNTWNLLPEGDDTLPLADRVNVVATCTDDVNMIIAGGLADDASDGVLMLGSD